MQTTLREAKAKLSEMVELASGGEEILITVHGKPKARLLPVRPIEDQENFATWAGVLRERAARYTVKTVDSSEEILKELREDRG
jgi:prevent-host-death family protein